MSTTTEYKVIGTRPIRHDGVDKVTGRALYGADFQMAGMLHGRILRSPHAHARIKKIDVSKALALPGDLRRQMGMVDDRDLGAAKHGRQLLRRHRRIAVDGHLGIIGAHQSFGNRSKGFIGVDEYGSQRSHL